MFYIAGDCVDVCTVEHACEGRVAGNSYQHITVGNVVGVATFERVIAGTSGGGILSLAERRNCHTNLTKSLNVKCQRILKGCGDIAGSIRPIGKVIHGDIAFDVAAIVGATRIFQCYTRTPVDRTAFLKFNFATIIQARNAAEGEHKV